MKPKLLFRALLLMLSFVVSFSQVKAQAWEEVEISDLTTSDVFLIVDTTSRTALTSANGTASAPTAVSVTMNESRTAIIGDIADELKWNISGNSSGYVFYPYGFTDKWLYCTNTNNGVRVGTNTNKEFTFSGNWLFNLVTSRYVGVYTVNPDWRCYTTTTGNIANTVTKFYKYVDNSSVERPTFLPAGGTYLTPQEIVISTSTPNTTILYTTDGSTPNSLSAVYTNPISINSTTIIKAIACTTTDTSVVGSATYTFPIQVNNIAELRQGVTGTTLYQLTGEAILTLQSSYR